MDEDNINLIEDAVIMNFNYIKNKYKFQDCSYKYIEDKQLYKTISIIKKSLIIYCFISAKEGFELNFKLNSWRDGRAIGVGKFYSQKYPNWNDLKQFIDNSNNFSDNDMFSTEWYADFIKFQLNFIEEHFPTVFTEGDLSMFEK
jgi:hypothetical protein